MNGRINRRIWMAGIGAGLVAAGPTGTSPRPALGGGRSARFRYALNTSTLMGHKLPLDEELRLIAQAGYDGVEVWVREIDAYQEAGGSVDDLGKLARDLGLHIAGAIAFAEWIVDDDAKRHSGLERARREMDLVRRIGGAHIAAPASGATDVEGMDPRVIAERYRALLKIGREQGVLPSLEVWGFSKTLGNLADVACVAVACGEPDATILPDVYHLYKGGSPPRGLRMLNGKAIPAIHMNDYPAEPPRERIDDSHRIYPGDGIAPIGEILEDLEAVGFEGFLSLELFNRDYWKRPAEEVLRTGLAKMKAVAERA
ncbi:MAG: xylose isomerase [Isosphaeraceae bacterium]|jgi:sugar phosphate isomerase/epimerase|nr:MAG: xylose isomerase [Isosphaeraceae bacterium]